MGTILIQSKVCFVLDDVVNVLCDLPLTCHCFCNGMGCCWIDFLGQIKKEIEISVFKIALLDVLISPHVLLKVLLRGLISHN